MQALTGSLTEASTIPLLLTSGDGQKDISLTLTDSLGNTNSYSKGVILDTIPPEIILSSH